MSDFYSNAQNWLGELPELYSLTGLALLIIAAWLANWMVKRVLLRGLYRALKATSIGQDGTCGTRASPRGSPTSCRR